jgi:hypothetical protein
MDPVITGQLTRDEIEKAQKDPVYRLKLADRKVKVPEAKRRGPRYTPVSRRQDRPNAILWLLRNHAELKDAAIMRLVGTTKTTIQQIRERSHWNAANLAPMDPVTLGLCSQLDLDLEVERASKGLPKRDGHDPEASILLSVDETTAEAALHDYAHEEEKTDELDADKIFAKLKAMNAPKEAEEE